MLFRSLADSVDFVALWYGAQKIGAVTAEAYTFFLPKDYAYYLDYTRAGVVVADASTLEPVREAAASSRWLRSRSRTASALSRAPCISCQSVKGIAGTFVVTARATTLTSLHEASISAMRARQARTAIILAALSEPKAIVLIGNWEFDRCKFTWVTARLIVRETRQRL